MGKHKEAVVYENRTDTPGKKKRKRRQANIREEGVDNIVL